MKIINKLASKNKDVYSVRPATIACFGDSVTQGCFEIYQTGENSLQTVFDQSSAYHAYLKELLAGIFPASPVNVINAGISGDNATGACERLERDVLSYKPDLVIVCFGLNDSTSGADRVDMYAVSIKKIITQCKESGAEVIVLTPNMMADKVSPHVINAGQPFVKKCIEGCIAFQNDGTLDIYVDAARRVARECEVPVCDVYAKWKALYAAGMDPCDLLSNNVNHPTRVMNRFTANCLLATMLENP